MKGNSNEKLRKLSLGVLLPILLMGVTVLLSEGKEASFLPTVSTTPTAVPTLSPSQSTITVLRGSSTTEMELEAYLVGVVLAEMPVGFEMDALRAQAVAARTYALKQCSEGIRHGENRVCTDPSCCQGYKSPEEYVAAGGSTASVAKVQQAVQDTKGLVAMYKNQLIMATFFSCSGGRTEDAVAVWGNDVPYLQSVESEGEEDGAAAYADSQTFTPEQLQNALGVQIKGPVDKWFGTVTYTDGGGVDTMVIGGVLYRGTTLRTLLNLRSTAFRVSVSGDLVTIHTKGYGHRVGMSQYGANAMAKAGNDFRQILQHYYQGVEIVQYS